MNFNDFGSNPQHPRMLGYNVPLLPAGSAETVWFPNPALVWRNFCLASPSQHETSSFRIRAESLMLPAEIIHACRPNPTKSRKRATTSACFQTFPKRARQRGSRIKGDLIVEVALLTRLILNPPAASTPRDCAVSVRFARLTWDSTRRTVRLGRFNYP